jgi:hypothetical protein
MTSADFNKTRAAFMRRVSAPDITPYALKLAYLIAFKYMNRESQTAFVGQDTLANDLKVSDRHVRRLLDLLQPLGLVIVLGHGPNRASTYWIDPDKATRAPNKRTRESGIKRTRESGIGKGKADSTRPKSGLYATENRTLESALLNKKNQEKNQGKSKSLSPPDFASPDSEKKKDSRRKKNKDAAKPKPQDTAESFERFWAVYPKRVAKEAARKAFARAVENGADPEALIIGAQRYAVERQGQDSKYTKHPATWLNAGCWNDEMPSGAVIDQDGNVVEVERPRRSNGPKTWAEVTDELLAEIGDGRDC